MQHPANKISIVSALLLSVALTACGGDKSEPQKQEPAKATPAATAEAPAENKAEVVQEPAKVETDAQVPAESAEPAKEQQEQEPAKDEPAAAPVKALSLAEGKKRYDQTCRVCHDQGLLDAPKLGDKAEWAKRLEKGVDTLHQHSAKGFNKMPAQATGQVTEAEVYAAVDYMLDKAK